MHKRVQTNTLPDCFYSSGLDMLKALFESPGALAGGSLSAGQTSNGKGLNLVLKPDSGNPPGLWFNYISPCPRGKINYFKICPSGSPRMQTSHVECAAFKGLNQVRKLCLLVRLTPTKPSTNVLVLKWIFNFPLMAWKLCLSDRTSTEKSGKEPALSQDRHSSFMSFRFGNLNNSGHQTPPLASER